MSLFLAIAITAFISTIVSFILGFIWYGPLFGKLWGSITHMDMNDHEKMAKMKKQMPYFYGVNFVLTFLMYYALGFSAALLVNPSYVRGIIFFALFVWLGFIVPIAGSNALWSGKSPKMSLKMFALTAGFQLIALVLAGLVWVEVYPHLM